MRKVEEIKEQIRNFSREEYEEFRNWFLEQAWKAWDKQIETNTKAEKFDKLVAEARAEYKSGKARQF